MRTHLELDDALLNQVIQLGRFPTKKAAVHAALLEYANLLKRRQLLALRGKVAWEGDLEQLRASRVGEAH
jgi:Arc/MetJ family transcription regulator